MLGLGNSHIFIIFIGPGWWISRYVGSIQIIGRGMIFKGLFKFTKRAC